MGERWIKICSLDDLPQGKMLPVDVADRELMVVNVGGRLYASDRICTHERADLSLGVLMGERVVCPLHLSQFDLRTGKAISPPANRPLKVYKVKIEGSAVLVSLE